MSLNGHVDVFELKYGQKRLKNGNFSVAGLNFIIFLGSTDPSFRADLVSALGFF